jgi:hypothetical protein
MRQSTLNKRIRELESKIPGPVEKQCLVFSFVDPPPLEAYHDLTKPLPAPGPGLVFQRLTMWSRGGKLIRPTFCEDFDPPIPIEELPPEPE